MVLMSGSRRARNQASIVNRPTCGGNKKAGILTYSSVGFLQSLSGASWRRSMTYPTNVCPDSYSLGGGTGIIRTQRTLAEILEENADSGNMELVNVEKSLYTSNEYIFKGNYTIPLDTEITVGPEDVIKIESGAHVILKGKLNISESKYRNPTRIIVYGELTMEELSEIKFGPFINESFDLIGRGIVISDGGIFNQNGGIINFENVESQDMAISVFNGATYNASGGSIHVDKTSSNRFPVFDIYSSNDNSTVFNQTGTNIVIGKHCFITSNESRKVGIFRVYGSQAKFNAHGGTINIGKTEAGTVVFYLNGGVFEQNGTDITIGNLGGTAIKKNGGSFNYISGANSFLE